MSPARPHRRGTPRGFLQALGLSLGLMLLVAGGVADRGGVFPLVVLGGAAVAIGALYLLFPHGPRFALGTTNGLAMYACLYVVLGRAGFPDAPGWARTAGFLLPVATFVVACWWRRRDLGRWVQGAGTADLAHLPRFARWLVVIGAVGVVSLSLPVNRMNVAGQGAALVGAMAVIALVSAVAVGDVVRLLVDIAVIFRAVTHRLSRLAVPIAAYSSLWALLTVVFGCLYRIADELSSAPLFHGAAGRSGSTSLMPCISASSPSRRWAMATSCPRMTASGCSPASRCWRRNCCCCSASSRSCAAAARDAGRPAAGCAGRSRIGRLAD